MSRPKKMFGDGGINQRFPERLELRQRAFFIAAHQTAIAGDIRGQHSRQSPFHALTTHDSPRAREARDVHHSSIVGRCPARTNVRVGSTTDLTALKPDFRFTPESRLRADIRACPKSANNGSRRLTTNIRPDWER